MKSIVRNYFFNLLSFTLTFIFGLLLSVVLARYLGVMGMGQYSYIVWLISSLALIFTLGIPNALVRFIAIFDHGKYEDSSHIISRVLLFELKISLIAAFISLIILIFLEMNNKIFYYIAILSFPFFVLNNILGSVFQGLQKFKLSSQINLSILSINLLLSLTVLIFSGGVREILVLNLFVAVVTFLAYWYFLRNRIKFDSPKLENKTYSQIFKYTTSTSVMVIIDLIVLERSEILFLNLFSTVEQIAFYALAYGFVTKIIVLFSGALSGVIMPKVAEYYGNNDHEPIKSIYYHSTRFLIFIISPLIMGGIVLSEMLVGFLYGTNYLPIVPVLRILLISGGFVAVVSVASSIIYGIGKQSIILKIGISLAIINLALDFLFIPRFGATGAAVATAIPQILGVLLGTFYMVYFRKMSFPLNSTLKVLTASFFSAAIIFLIKNYWFNPLFVQIIILPLIFLFSYISFLFILRFFDKKDLILLETARNFFIRRV